MRYEKAASRLLVVDDFERIQNDPYSSIANWLKSQVITLAAVLDGTGVTMDLSRSLRAVGYEDLLRTMGRIQKSEKESAVKNSPNSWVKFMASLNLFGCVDELRNEALMLDEVGPSYVTAMCVCGTLPLQVLKAKLQNSKIIGVAMPVGGGGVGAFQTPTERAKRIDQRFYDMVDIAKASRLHGMMVPTIRHVRSLKYSVGDSMLVIPQSLARPDWFVPETASRHEATPRVSEMLEAGADLVRVSGTLIMSQRDPERAVLETLAEIEGRVSVAV